MSNRDSAIAFTPIEEAFFRTGEMQSEQAEAEPIEDERAPRRPLLRRLFSRKATQQ